MQDIQKVIEERIMENIDRYFHIPKKDVSIRKCTPIITTCSIVYEFEVKGDGKTYKIIAKTPTSERRKDEDELLSSEYKALTYLYSKMLSCNPNCQVVRPLDFFEDLDVLLTEKAKGENLCYLLYRYNHPFALSSTKKKLRSWIRGCGAWLRAFHDLTFTEHRLFKADAFLLETKEMIDNILKAGFKDTSFASYLLKSLEGVCNNIDEKHEIGVSCKHHDFVPSHLFVDGQMITSIDFTLVKKEVIYEDITYFLIYLQAANLSPRRIFYNRRFAKVLEGDFLTVYFEEEKKKDESISLFLNLYKIKNLLKGCLYNYRNAKKRGDIFLFLAHHLRYKRFYTERIKEVLEILEHEFTPS